MATEAALRPEDLQLWGGIECTVNRVGDDYRDQLLKNGHAGRLSDLDRFAQLGITAIRYPLLWERTGDVHGNVADWSWPDERLPCLRALGIHPIVGLVHHGSGPPGTSLTSQDFASGLARYAASVAQRHPWVEYYTPVNEPLTTARFSGLYGHWYPHGRSDLQFAQALVNQCRAVVLSMQAIHEVNPAAKLVQTENLEQIHSTRKLRYQADFENERRWLSIDLILGRVDRRHPMWDYLLYAGLSPRDVEWFAENPLPSEVILGWNYYLTSERFLDQRLRRYPAESHGGNGREPYADIEAVRVRGEGIAGLGSLLQQAWQRFQRPMAVTEVHLGCHRESQLRWLLDAWNTAAALREAGVDVRAVTAWSLLGAYDWNSLCTRSDGHYEPGVFDLRGGEPRPTALAALMRDLAARRTPTHPALPERGWWDLPQRVIYRPVYTTRRATRLPALTSRETAPLMIIGATGTLGQALARACRARGLACVVLSRADADITQPQQIDRAIAAHRPWAILNAAGYVRVDDAESDAPSCLLVNATGPANLARVCHQHGVPLVTFSSDLVFDGQRQLPYVERDQVRPLSVYGRSKAEAEQQVLDLHPEALVIRTSAFFGPWDEYNFLSQALCRLAAGLDVVAADDWIVSPTYVPDLVHACLDLLIDREHGVWHLANSASASWADFARMGAVEAGLDQRLIRGCPGSELRLAAPRPAFSALGSERGLHLPPLGNAVRRYCAETKRAAFTSA